MVHLTRTVLVLGSVLSSLLLAPSQGEAGVIPWVYNAIFGPVGSMRGGYVPTYASYAPRAYSAGYGGYGVGYGNYSAAYTSYAPTTVAYAPSYGGYGNSCGCSGQTTAYAPTTSYAPVSPYDSVSSYGGATSNCNNCASGNCTSTTAGYPATLAPRPSTDSNSSSSDVLHRLEKLEHDTNQLINFLKKQHNEDFSPSPYTGRTSTYKGTSGTTETVHPRERRRDTIESDRLDNDNFPRPRRGGAPVEGLEGQENRKIEINPPASGTETPVKPDANDAGKPAEEEPQVLRLDTRITTRAVAPRERIQLSTTPRKLNVAKAGNNSPKKPTRFLLESSLPGDVARH